MISNLKKLTANRKFKWIVFIVVFLCYVPYIVSLFSKIPIDSDYSNLVLEAGDIAGGNFFLSGWNQTGISFFSTDLLFYIIGVAVAGVSTWAYVIASVLMFVVWAVCAQFVIKAGQDKYTIFDLLLFLAIAGFPCLFNVNMLRAHTAVMIWGVLALIFINKAVHDEHNKRKGLYTILAFLLLFMGCFGDQIIYVFFIAPIVIYYLRDLLSNQIKTAKKDILIIGICVAAVVFAFLADKLYYMVGDANKNAFLDSKAFEPFDNLYAKIILYIKSIFYLNDMAFNGQTLFSLSTPLYLLRTIVVFYAFYVVIKNIRLFIRNKEVGLIDFVLSAGFVLMSLVYILTNISVDENSSRYFGTLPGIFAILIIRHLNRTGLWERARLINGKVKASWIAACVAVVMIVSSFVFPLSVHPAETEQERLGKYLKSQGLSHGYATFWNASAVTVTTGQDVNVRSVWMPGDAYEPYIWFCKDEWYEEESNFVVVRNPEHNENFRMTEESVVSYWGQYDKKLTFENYVILVFDHDISEEMCLTQSGS